MNSLLRTILAATLVSGTALAAIAAPPAKRSYTSAALRTAEEFQAPKSGDKIALVCTQCSTVTVTRLTNPEEAMTLCKVDETIVCGSCKEQTRVVRHGPRSRDGSHSEVRYVNAKGEECLFVAKLEN